MAVGAHKARLGRGLASLIGGPLDEAALAAEGEQRNLPLGAIKPGRFNPRRNFAPAQLDELAASIRERGLVQPLVVRPSASNDETYEIVAGERRWRAAQLASLHEVPVVVRALSRPGSGRDRHHRERPARRPERDRGGGGLQAADGRPRLYAGGPRQGHRQEPEPPRQHAPPAEAARQRAGAGADRGAQRRPRPRA